MRLSSDEQNGSTTLRFTAWRLHEDGVSAVVGRQLCYLARGRMMVS